MGSVSLHNVATSAPVSGATAAFSSRRERYKRAWITFSETLRLSLDALRAHKLRSFLTLLGVILAVTTLVVVMSVISGLNLYVADRVANLGANVFIVDRFGIITSQDQWVKAQKRSSCEPTLNSQGSPVSTEKTKEDRDLFPRAGPFQRL